MLLLLICLINFAIAQVPQPCTTPPQWEARIYSRNDGQKSMVAAKWSYDSIYQRVRVLQDITFGSVDNHYDIIRLFQNKVQFTIDLKTNNCSRVPLDRPWRDFGQVPGAQSLGEAYVGSSAIPGAGVRVTLWIGNETFADNRTVTYRQAWTYEGCFPVFDTTVDPKSGVSYTAYYDTTSGVSDPNVFIPPQQCLTDEEYAMRHVLFGPVKHEKIN